MGILLYHQGEMAASNIQRGNYDPYWNNVVFLAPLSTDLLDVKGHALTVSGVALNGTTAKWGSESALATTTQYIQTTDFSIDFNLGAVNFTLEFWWYSPSHTISMWPMGTNATNGAAQNNFWQFNINTGSGTNKFSLNFQYSNLGGVYRVIGISNADITEGAWHWTQVIRNGNTVTIAVDGVSLVSGTLTAAIDDGTSTNRRFRLFSGTSGSATAGTLYMQDARVTKGIARAISFPTAPLPLY